jgi:endonuclease III
MELSALLTDIYRTLREAFGYQDWWPAQTAFEVMVGAVLTQRTNWSNVEKALSALKAAGLMEPGALAEADPERLQSLIRPAGYYRQKSRNLLRLVQWFVARSGGDIASRNCCPCAGSAPRRRTACCFMRSAGRRSWWTRTRRGRWCGTACWTPSALTRS